MTQVLTSGRHRAARRPSTPLDLIGSSIATSLSGNVGRGAVVAVASSGLVFGISAAASAEPEIKAPSLKTISLTADQITRSATQESVSVEAGAEVSFSTASLTAIAPPPPPPPPVVRTVTASRTRTAVTPATTRTTTETAAADVASDAEPEAQVEAAPAPAIDGDAAAAVISIARQYIGVPYVSGGASPSGFDCSGFTQYVFAQIGVSLPRTSSAQRNAGYVVSASEARAGDLIWAPGHVGIYLGNGQHIAARNYSTPLSEGPVYMKNPTYIRVLG